MTRHSELVRWAVLDLLVAPSGDFKGKTVAHAEWHFKLTRYPSAASVFNQFASENLGDDAVPSTAVIFYSVKPASTNASGRPSLSNSNNSLKRPRLSK